MQNRVSMLNVVKGVVILFFFMQLYQGAPSVIAKRVILGIFLCIIAFSIYNDYLNKKVNYIATWILKKADSTKARQLLDDFRKQDIFGLKKKKLFILECYLKLDEFNEGEIEAFIDTNQNNKLLRNDGCNLSFEIMLLEYFFIKDIKDSTLSLCNRLRVGKYKIGKTTLNVEYQDLINCFYDYYSGDMSSIDRLINMDTDRLSQRNKAYKNLFISLMYDRINEKTKRNKFIETAYKFGNNIPLIENHYKQFITN